MRWLNAVAMELGAIRQDGKVNDLLKSVRAIMFDMDGTLTVPRIDFEKMRRLTGVRPGQPIFETVMTYSEREKVEALEYIREVEREARIGQELMEGTVELLSYLQQSNVPAAVLTRNDREGVDFLVDSLGIPQPFNAIYARDFAPSKPDPAALLHWSAQINISTSQMLMIGDHTEDMMCGHRAGCLTCMIEQTTNLQDRANAHFTVSSPAALLDALKEAWSPDQES